MMFKCKIDDINFFLTKDGFLKCEIKTRDKWNDEVVVVHELPVKHPMYGIQPYDIKQVLQTALKECHDWGTK